MSKKSALIALGVVGAVVAGGVAIAVRRSRSEPPPISPSVPRVEDARSEPAPAETGA